MNHISSERNHDLLFGVGIEAMHAKRPLQAHERAFDAWQEEEGEDHRERQPECHMHPQRRPVGHLNGQHETDDNVADNDDSKIGRCVVCPMMVQSLTAMRTGIGHL